MMNTIAAVFKYSFLVLTILVLSHVIQIKGTTVSQHVENGMSWVSGGRSHSNFTTRVTQQFSSAVHHDAKEDADGISREDKKELDSVIKRSSHR
jgi:hypothetical protein